MNLPFDARRNVHFPEFPPEIKGYSQAYLNASSPRSQQIKDQMKRAGFQGPEAAQIAAHATRDRKQTLTPAEVLAAHKEMAAEYGNQPEHVEIDLVQRFGHEPLESIDKFTLQTHVNDLARRYSQDRVKQARSYLKSIFDEAVAQEFLVKDPTRKLKIPKNLRPKDKQVLTWEQLRAILANSARRDRLLLMLEMTDALRPSELFALRWLSFDDENTLSLTETVYRRQLRPFGKTVKSLGKMSLPNDLVASSGSGRGSARTRLGMRLSSRTRTEDYGHFQSPWPGCDTSPSGRRPTCLRWIGMINFIGISEHLYIASPWRATVEAATMCRFFLTADCVRRRAAFRPRPQTIQRLHRFRLHRSKHDFSPDH